MNLDEYKDRFSCAQVDRDTDGVLTVRMHSEGGVLVWGGPPHSELPELFSCIASDRRNRAVILTGTGDAFITLPTGDSADLAHSDASAFGWDKLIFEAIRLISQLLEIEVPIICAVNGPTQSHSELAVLCDIVLAADDAYFTDAGHLQGGLVPGDGMQIIWPLLIGHNRARYFMLTGRKINALEALDLGVVAEVLPREALLTRAQELARDLATRNPALIRNSRHIMVRQIKKLVLDDLELGLALEAVAALTNQAWAAGSGPRTRR